MRSRRALALRPKLAAGGGGSRGNRRSWRSWPIADPDVRATLIVNGVTVGVAVGLLRNAQADTRVGLRPWHVAAPAPFVGVVVPMRDETANVPGCIGSLLAQRYPHFEVVVVDDNSTDGTAAALQTLAVSDPRLRVVTGHPLPAGWTGKNWALQQGLDAVDPRAAWVLTVDADMRFHPLALASALHHAEEHGADLLTLIPRLELGSFWEKVLVPHAGEMYSLLVGSQNQVNDPANPAVGANGQFMLLRRAVYAAVGGQAAVRAEVAEDWALAGRIKRAGYRLRMAQGQSVVQARVYAGLGQLWAGFSKTLFPASGRSLPRVALTIVLLTTYGVLPWWRLGRATAALARASQPAARARARQRTRLALTQIVPMLALRTVLDRYLGISPLYAFTYPLAILLGDGMLLWSAWRYLSGRGMAWKGRTYG